MIIRAISFLMVLVTALFLPFWIFIIASTAYAFVYAPYEILILGLFVDALFGGSIQSAGYIYTLSSAILGAVVLLSKPFFSFTEEV